MTRLEAEPVPDERLPPLPLNVQQLLDQETQEVSPAMRARSFAEIPVEVHPDAYRSPSLYRQELNAVWGKVWQMACLEQDIPNPGDVHVYEVGNYSILVTRVDDSEIRAYHNACLHRGRRLCDNDTTRTEFRCPYHSWAWALDGTFKDCPNQWDYPDLDPAELALPEVRVGTWEGFVFVNLNPDCEPLETYLGGISEHFVHARPPLHHRWKAVHVAKMIRANWKVGLEAFLEAHHGPSIHPQTILFAGAEATECDVYPDEKNWTRIVTPFGIPSGIVDYEVTEDDVVNSFQEELRGVDEPVTLPDGYTARQFVADHFRTVLGNMTGFDASQLSVSELVDAYQYFIFPNFLPFFSSAQPLVFRFRPVGPDPETCVMDVMYLIPWPDGTDRPPATKVRLLSPEQSFVADAPELGPLAAILDQDMNNAPNVQLGLRATVADKIRLSNYYEVQIRQLHRRLQECLSHDEM